jgi:predicted RNA binding protein YcfA (HicA-like mRNA interferase family)
MPALHSVKPQECVRALEHLGFTRGRQTGSHLMMQKGGVSIPVPMHKGKDVSVRTLSRILRSAGVSAAEFLAALP